MHYIPFRRKIDELFRSDKSAVRKMFGGAFVGAFLFVGIVWEGAGGGGSHLSATAKTSVIVGAAFVGALVVLGFLLREVVLRRVNAGERVNAILLAYFGKGNGCLMLCLWVFTVFFATFIVTLLTVNF